MNHNLRIENPCPFRPTVWNKTADGHFCKGCKKNVVDMRGKSVEEIRSAMTSEFCGIFTNDQLPGQQRMKFSRRMIFNMMAMLSFLGFSVKPMSTSAKPSNSILYSNISTHKTIDGTDEPSEKKKKKKKRKSRKQRKADKRFGSIGCPAF